MSAEPIRIPVPVEAQSVVFEVTGRGYDRRQVDDYVRRLEQELAEVRWELEAREAERARVPEGWDKLEAARRDFARIRSAWRPSYAEFSARLEQVLTLAEEQAAEIVDSARREGERLRAAVEAEIAQIRAGIAGETAQLRRAAAAEQDVIRERVRQQGTTLERELAERRRDAELAATGLVAKARVQAEELLTAARRDLAETERQARNRLAALTRQRGDAAAEVALRDRLIGLVAAMEATTPREARD